MVIDPGVCGNRPFSKKPGQFPVLWISIDIDLSNIVLIMIVQFNFSGSFENWCFYKFHGALFEFSLCRHVKMALKNIFLRITPSLFIFR